MGAPRVIKLLVISDIICPWCYIGQREMERAVEMCRDLPIDVEIEYRPYRIYPSLKDGQFMEKRPWYEERFGKDKTQEMERVALQRADELGLNIKYMDGIITQTTLAHRMLLKAWQLGGQASQQAFLTVLFKGYFENLANIGDTEVLADMAVDAKLMTKEEAVSFLESTECLDEVERMMNEARKKGVNGVPFVVIDGKWAVSGGQTAEVYAQILKKLANSEPTTPRPTHAAPPAASVPLKA
ncbi:thioredoxin-like protein [Phanerochaete sordida]|uniref:Thioredoxin-like protein n=1 Tax=Phanerochaete sordida TaxID=48140 RepID=A0A9P3GI85_9APHY|nr:thioredoxin-like protein [Phanerochaete sordida]